MSAATLAPAPAPDVDLNQVVRCTTGDGRVAVMVETVHCPAAHSAPICASCYALDLAILSRWCHERWLGRLVHLECVVCHRDAAEPLLTGRPL